jgi:glycosyltransferase involved in cell wall biosynthesis
VQEGHPVQAVRGLKILYHHRTRSRDGQSIHIDALIGALRGADHEVIVVGPKQTPATAEPLNRKLLPKFIYELLEFGYNVLEFAKLAAAAARHRPDALYERANIFTLSGLWISQLYRLPFLLEVNAPLSIERQKFGGLSLARFATWTEHAAWRGADRVLPVTDVLAKEIENARVPRSHILVVPNGVDLSKLKAVDPKPIKQALGLGQGLTIGFVGFVRDWHGLDQIVDLLANEPVLANAEFLIVGDGPACPGLRQQAERLGIADRVVITGVFQHERLPEYLSAIDIAVQPEVTPYASPLKLMEYMALGRTIVAPDAANIREILEHEVDALLFRHGDRKALQDALKRLASDEALRFRLGAAAAAKVVARRLTWAGNAERVVALIEDCRRRNGRSAS